MSISGTDPTGSNWTGPGFIVTYPIDGGNEVPVLVTNKHVLSGASVLLIRKFTGEVLDLPAKQVSVFDEAIDLGVVFKARTIQECVDALFAQAGIVVAAKALPPEPIE